MDPDGGIFVVADGLGGRPGGETASRRAAEVFAQLVSCGAGTRHDHDALRAAVGETNRAVRALGDTEAALAGSGTTLSALVLDASGATVVHVGDSRILLFRSGALTQLTTDHTVEAEYRREAAGHAVPLNPAVGTLLARAVGAGDAVEPQILDTDLRDGDVFLLVTDGIGKVLDHAALEALVAGCRSSTQVQEVCERVFEAVRAAAPADDTTVGVVRVRVDAAEWAAP
jgi:protein phosphatase